MIHLQTPVTNWLTAVDLLPDQSLVKAVDNVQALAEVKAHNANIKTVLRHWYDPGQVFGGTFEQNKQRARVFFDTWIDGTFAQYAGSVDYVLEFNEYIANSHNATEKADRIRWARACAEVWRDEYRTRPGHGHIRLALCSTAVGNDIPWEYAQIAVQYDCILSYHAYTHWTIPGAQAKLDADDPLRHIVASGDPAGRQYSMNIVGYRFGATNENGTPTRSPGDWQYLSGRWATMDADFRRRGYTVKWMFGECGPFQSAATGWRHSSCLGASQDAYVEAVRRWIQDCRGTHAFQTGRLIGFNLFTTGGGSQWQWFETRQPELNALAQMTAVEWTGQPEPPPPPPPPDPDPQPGELQNGSFEDGWYHPNGVPELQIPNHWQFAYDDTTPNPYDDNPWSQYVRPEVRVLPADQLPPDERPLFIRDGVHTLKPFKGNGAWWAWFWQALDLPAGTYRFRSPIFGDLVKAYQGDQKVWADDPQQRDGQYRYTIRQQGSEWHPIIPGQWNEISHTFAHGGGPVMVGLEVRCNFALVNSGLFADDWTLGRVSMNTWNKLVYLLPQNTTPDQYDAVQEIAYPTRSEIAFSADSAFARPSNVGTHRVIVYDVDAWGGQQALEEWVTTSGYDYDPPTTIEYRDWPTALWPWPVDNANHQVNAPFGEPRDYDGDGIFDDRHEGIDLFAQQDDPIIAVMGGTVVWASNKRRSNPSQDSLYGWHVIISHPGDLYETWYCHMDGVFVSQGDAVQRGHVLGPAGNTGNSNGVHLHFNVRKSGHIAGRGFVPSDVIDPAPLLGIE